MQVQNETMLWDTTINAPEKEK